jgi:hypothetical protein
LAPHESFFVIAILASNHASCGVDPFLGCGEIEANGHSESVCLVKGLDLELHKLLGLVGASTHHLPRLQPSDFSLKVFCCFVATIKNLLQRSGTHTLALKNIGELKKLLKIEEFLVVIVRRLACEKNHNPFRATLTDNALKKNVFYSSSFVPHH